MMVYLGSPVKTKQTLSNKSFIADKIQKTLRKSDSFGVVDSYPQQSNTVLVQHPGDTAPAIYTLDEVEDADAWWRVEHAVGSRIFFKEFGSFSELEEYLIDNGVNRRDAMISPPVFGVKEHLEEGFIETRPFLDTLLDDEL